MKQNLTFLIIFLFAISAEAAFAQCGPDGTQPCGTSKNSTSKTVPKTNKTPNTSTTKKDNPDSSKSITSSDSRKKKSQKSKAFIGFSYTLMFKDSIDKQKIAFQTIDILLENGFKQNNFEKVFDPKSLNAYGRKDNNIYITFDTSAPANVRAKILKLVSPVLPNVIVEENNWSASDKSMNNHILIWIL